MAALTLLTKMRPPSPTIAVVARGLVMRLVDLSFPPDAEHTPGIGHVLADRLSRAYAPIGSGKISSDLRPALAASHETTSLGRAKAWYRV